MLGTHLLAVLAALLAGPVHRHAVLLHERLEFFLAAFFGTDLEHVAREQGQTHGAPPEIVDRLLDADPAGARATMKAHKLVGVVGPAPLAGKFFGEFWLRTDVPLPFLLRFGCIVVWFRISKIHIAGCGVVDRCGVG